MREEFRGTKARRQKGTKGSARLDRISLRAFVPPGLRAFRSAFTLLEMLTTVAVLVIVLGLMVDLAGYVRNRSATDLAHQVLARLDQAMGRYVEKFHAYPEVHPFTASPDLAEDEETLLKSARQNNRDFVAALSAAGLLDPNRISGAGGSLFEGSMLHDAWDMPIVFMPASHGKIGMAPSGRGFFFSAGPDRLYKKREDNVYSYEVTRPTE